MKTYSVRTFGCQMNKHDAERTAGLLESCGMSAAQDPSSADVVVFLTCCVRENADERLRGQVASLKALKTARPGTLIAVGGCIGQRDGESLLRALPHVDVVFGTYNLGRLPALLQEAESSDLPVVEVFDTSDSFTTDLPSRRERPFHAWVPITVGCDNFCSYCIVPHVRGRERSRPAEQIESELERLAADGVVEVTLLGQNVNSYGRDLYGEPRFAPLLQRAAASGIQRIRFATSHPKDLSEDTIGVMASEAAICASLHLPVQSGSNRILAAMNRHYTAEDYLALVERLYDTMPGLSLSTDIIVGFPTESEADFEDTIALVKQAHYDQAFTFIYSPRAGTPAADMDGQVPREVTQERFDRLVTLVHSSATQKNAALVGTVQQVLLEGGSKRDPDVLTGRNEGNKVVHAPVPEGTSPGQWAGRIADIRIGRAQTWFLEGSLDVPLDG